MSLVAQIPAPVFASTTQSAARIFISTGQAWDFAIGGMPFNGAATEQRPLVRQTAPSRKEQSDQSREPGEHSLAFWWTKAQSSFHGGAGQKYLNSDDQDELGGYRFLSSEGLDVFSEPGKVSVLPGTQRIAISSGTPLIAPTDAGEMYVADGTSLTRHYMTPTVVGKNGPQDAMTFNVRTVAWGGANPILALAVAGSTYAVATHEGVYIGSGTGAATKVYTLPNNSVPVLGYVKQRLMLALSTATSSPVYGLDIKAAGGTALPTALFSVGPNWTWTAMSQTPSSILLAGNSVTRSSVYRINLNTQGAAPVLMPGVVSAEFPPDEIVRAMETYLGSVIGVQTTEGFRAGILNAQGDFQYGSLLFRHPYGAVSSAVFGAGNSLYAGWQDAKGAAGLVRVDLTEVLGNNAGLRFPYAGDLRAMDSGATVSGTVSDGTLWTKGRKVFVVPGKGVFAELHGKSTLGGSLTTSRIRWDTLEPKIVRHMRIRGEGTSGRISAEVARDSDTNFTSIGAIDIARQADSDDMSVMIPATQFLTARITLTGEAVLTGYQLKALPAQRRQRFLQVPLFCFDREIDNSGQIVGRDGEGMERLLALEQLEQTGDIVALQWLSSHPDQELTEFVTIEQLEFAQTSGPSDRRGWGGIVTLTLRTVG